MTAVLVGQFRPGSPEWHAARMTGIGGSEIAAVLGLSPFESRFSLYHRKRGELAPVDETPEMEWGKRLENAVARKFLDGHPEFSDEGIGSVTFNAAGRPWQIANPDRLLHARRPDGDVDLVSVLECKTSPMGDGYGPTDTDQVPPHVRCQAIWYGDVLEVPRAHVACLIGGCDYREYTIEWDDDEAELLRTAARIFLDDIANDVRPDIDAHTATWSATRELHPDIEPVEHELDGRLARRYIAARAALADAETEHAEARALVFDAMGSARTAVWDGQKVATRQAKGDGLPYLVAARTLPSLTTPHESSAA